MTDIFVCGAWPTTINTHTHTRIQLTALSRKEQQGSNGKQPWLTSKKPKVPQVCVPASQTALHPSETGNSKGTGLGGSGTVLLDLCSSSSDTEKVTENPLASVSILETPPLRACPAQEENFMWTASLSALNNLVR